MYCNHLVQLWTLRKLMHPCVYRRMESPSACSWYLSNMPCVDHLGYNTWVDEVLVDQRCHYQHWGGGRGNDWNTTRILCKPRGHASPAIRRRITGLVPLGCTIRISTSNACNTWGIGNRWDPSGVSKRDKHEWVMSSPVSELMISAGNYYSALEVNEALTTTLPHRSAVYWMGTA